MPNGILKPPQYPPQKEIGGAWEETNLEKEAIEPMEINERIEILNNLIKEYQEMKKVPFPKNELELKEEEIFEKWNELDKILPKKDKRRNFIEKEMEKIGL